MKRAWPTNSAARDLHGIGSLTRLTIAALIILFLVWFGGVVFEGLDFRDLASRFINDHPILKRLLPFPEFYTVILEPKSWRYFIAPVAAMIAIFLGAASYVRDIYALERLRDGLNFVITAIFGLRYPIVNVEGGKVSFPTPKTELINKIGGPGFCTIQPGNAVQFHRLREPSNITVGETYFLEPFERIGSIGNLDDQDGFRDGITVLSRDGIKITIKDIHFRYRVYPEIINGQPVRRSTDDPYPFNDQAFWNMTYNLVVDDKDLEEWRDAVSRVIVGGITDFINLHDIDYLTSPRENRQDPRREIRHSLFFGGTRVGLRNLGAELLWVDIGHFAIDDKEVDEIRQNLWAADWLGDAMVTRAEGQVAYQNNVELGRAEAQAELIVAIAEALQPAAAIPDPPATLRRIVLIRTAQLLETYSEQAQRVLLASSAQEKKP